MLVAERFGQTKKLNRRGAGKLRRLVTGPSHRLIGPMDKFRRQSNSTQGRPRKMCQPATDPTFDAASNREKVKIATACPRGKQRNSKHSPWLQAPAAATAMAW